MLCIYEIVIIISVLIKKNKLALILNIMIMCAMESKGEIT